MSSPRQRQSLLTQTRAGVKPTRGNRVVIREAVGGWEIIGAASYSEFFETRSAAYMTAKARGWVVSATGPQLVPNFISEREMRRMRTDEALAAVVLRGESR